MKTIANLLMLSGGISTIFGLIPYLAQFPRSKENSGPANFWELIIYLAYDGKGWFLLFGIIVLLIGIFIRFKIKNLFI